MVVLLIVCIIHLHITTYVIILPIILLLNYLLILLAGPF